MIEIIVPTIKTKDDYINSTIYKCLSNVIEKNVECRVTVVPENKRGFCELYNQFIETTAADILIFMHDDLEIHDHFFIDKIIKAHEKYDIVGLAGSASQQYTSSCTPAWHLCMDKREDGRGFLSHQIPAYVGGYPFPYINSSFYGPTPAPVVFVDGVFTSFNVNKIRESNVKFNEKYTFHHYDMSMCADACKVGLSIGVTPIFGIHHGLGDFNSDALWHKLAKSFVVEYNNYKKSV